MLRSQVIMSQYAFSEDTKTLVLKKLTEKGAVRDCPRCGNKTFSIIDGYFNQTLQNDLNGFVIGGPSVPAVVVACNNCG